MNHNTHKQTTDRKAKYEQPRAEIFNFSNDIVQTSGDIDTTTPRPYPTPLPFGL